MLLYRSAEDEKHGHAGGEYPDACVGRGGNRKTARFADPLLEVLNINSKRSSPEYPRHINTPQRPMHLPILLPQPVGKL
jgi:hypothetical protein